MNTYKASNINEMFSIYKNMVDEVSALEKMFPGRHFTLDGHLIGSIGEVAAEYYYGIHLATTGMKAIDGEINGRTVQIKTVQQDTVMLVNDKDGIQPYYLLVLYLNKSGFLYEVYNGLCEPVFSAINHSDSHGYKHISVNRLMEMNPVDGESERIKQIFHVEKMQADFKNPKEKRTDKRKQIRSWADKYLRLYEDESATEIDLAETFADECFSLGFEMDCGHMFEALYGDDALYNIESFRKALTKVEDPMLLGSAIFSRWRYLTHWGYNESLTDEESRAWFIAAFRRMMEIV